MDDQGTRLLRAVIAEPLDDLPRLAYADWLEETATQDADCPYCALLVGQCALCRGDGHGPGSAREMGNGHAERAEFIRVQCEIAEIETALQKRFPNQDLCTGESANWCPNCGDCCCPYPEQSKDWPGCPLHAPKSRHANDDSLRAILDALRRRERELLQRAMEWVSVRGSTTENVGVCDCLPDDRTVRSESHGTYYFKRGFAEEIACSWSWFRTHYPAIRERTPLRKVRLTDRPSGYFHFGGWSEAGVQLMLRTRYPGLEFELSSAINAQWSNIQDISAAVRRLRDEALREVRG